MIETADIVAARLTTSSRASQDEYAGIQPAAHCCRPGNAASVDDEIVAYLVK